MILDVLEPDRLTREALHSHILEPWMQGWLLACAGVYRQRAVLFTAEGSTLPLVQIRKRLVALPYAHFLTLPGEFVTQAVTRLCRERPGVALELRLGAPDLANMGGVCRDYDTFVIDVAHDIWSAVGSRRRGKIRKAPKLGCRAQWGREELFDEFYDLYADRSRELGTPPHSYQFLKTILSETPDANILLVRHKEVPVAASFLTVCAHALVSQWAASRAGFASFYLNDFMYWEMVEYCRRTGIPCLDLGRAMQGTGLYTYKSQWPAQAVPLYYYWIGKPLMIASEGRRSLKARLFSQAWTLLPSPVSRTLGGLIRKRIA